MTNIISPKIGGLDPNNQGRSVADRLAKVATEQFKTISSSRPFVAFVIITGLALGFYYFILAAPIYVSETSLQVRGREQPPAAAGGLIAALGAPSGGVTNTDIAAVDKFITSYEMAQKLDQRFSLRQVYARPRPDFLNWLPKRAPRERYLDFYRKMVRVKVDHETQLITVDVKAFDPALAQQMGQAIVVNTAEYVNDLSAMVRRDTLRSSEDDLKKAEDAARQARLAMTSFRASTGLIDPTATAAATSAGMAGMQQQIVQTRAEMAQLLSVNTPNSPAVQQLRARIAGLQEQIDAEQRRVANTGAQGSLDQRLRDYEGLIINSEYADKQVIAAMAAVDSAKSLASQRERFIVPILAPSLPQTATEPRRLLSFLEAMFVLVAIYGIVALAIAGVRDHQGI